MISLRTEMKTTTHHPVAATRPEKTDVLCEEALGFGTAKAVVTSRAVMVHAFSLVTPSQESSTGA